MKTDDYLKAYLLIRRCYSIGIALEKHAGNEVRGKSLEGPSLLLSLCLYSLNQLLERLKVPNRAGPPEKIPANSHGPGLLNEGLGTLKLALELLDPITTPTGMAPAPYHDLLLIVLRLREVRYAWTQATPEGEEVRGKSEELELEGKPLSKKKTHSKAAGADASENPAT